MTTPLVSSGMFNSQTMMEMLKFKMLSDFGLNGISSGSNLITIFLCFLGLMLYEHYRTLWTYFRNWYYNVGKQKLSDYKCHLHLDSGSYWLDIFYVEYNRLKLTVLDKVHFGRVDNEDTGHHKFETIPNIDNYIKFMTRSNEMKQPFSYPLKKLGFGKWIYYFRDDKSSYLVCDTKFLDLVDYMKELVAKHHLTTKSCLTINRQDGTSANANTNKSFDNVFFEQKQEVLKVVDKFMNYEWYRQRGLPHHLGILLKGAPGTGKTSFIKALAKYTSKNIYTIDMSKVTMKYQFLSYIEKYSEKNVIVFEDFDRLKCIVDMMTIQTIRDSKGINKDDTKDNKDIDTKHDISFNCKSELLNRLYTTYTKATTDETRQHALDDYKKELEKSKGEDLDLAFILNVLDGVAEHRNRILVFTCNNPEVLSDAFLRPGRIDVIIDFKRANRDIIRDILVHYYQLDVSKRDELNVSGIPDYKYTPAEIICVCKKHETPFPVIKALKQGMINTSSNIY